MPIRTKSDLLGAVSAARRRAGVQIPPSVWLVAVAAVASIIAYGFVGLTVWLGIGVLLLGLSPAWAVWRSRHWPEATATVVAHEVIRQTATDRDDGHVRELFGAEARYVFRAAGREITGLRSQAGITPTEDLAEAVDDALGVWAVGRTFPVRHHPTRPFTHTTKAGDQRALPDALREGAPMIGFGLACFVAAALQVAIGLG